MSIVSMGMKANLAHMQYHLEICHTKYEDIGQYVPYASSPDNAMLLLASKFGGSSPNTY